MSLLVSNLPKKIIAIVLFRTSNFLPGRAGFRKSVPVTYLGFFCGSTSCYLVGCFHEWQMTEKKIKRNTLRDFNYRIETCFYLCFMCLTKL